MTVEKRPLIPAMSPPGGGVLALEPTPRGAAFSQTGRMTRAEAPRRGAHATPADAPASARLLGGARAQPQAGHLEEGVRRVGVDRDPRAAAAAPPALQRGRGERAA